MATIFQKMFLSKQKIAQINQEQEILRLISTNPISHRAYITKTNGVVRRMSVIAYGYNIYAERSFERNRPMDAQVKYSLVFATTEPTRIKFATNSDIDKIAQTVFTKMRKKWEKTKQNVR